VLKPIVGLKIKFFLHFGSKSQSAYEFHWKRSLSAKKKVFEWKKERKNCWFSRL